MINDKKKRERENYIRKFQAIFSLIEQFYLKLKIMSKINAWLQLKDRRYLNEEYYQNSAPPEQDV